MRPSNLLFVLNHGLYLRNYGAVLTGLADRGHRIDLAFSQPRAGDAEIFQAVASGHDGIALVESPRRTGWWWAALDPLRALRDYVHYLNPAFDEAPKLIGRAERRVPRAVRNLLGRRGGSRRIRGRAIDVILKGIERSIRPDPGVRAWLLKHRPDAVLLSPLIDFDFEQLEVLKAAGALGIPTGHLVASWDNLSNKGRVQMQADRIIVWNEVQRKEAAALHGIEPERVVATGAQLYDHWFDRKPSNREAFFDRVGGLDVGKPLILYVGSSPFISPNEADFVKTWLAQIRAHPDSMLRDAQVMVRPHPLNAEQWQQAHLDAFGPAVVWPATGAMPIAADDQRDYFDSLFHAAAVVGINTSAFLEAGIVGRRMFTVASAGFAETQIGTLHFRYIADSGLVEVSETISDHLEMLARALRGEEGDREARRAFLQAFLRPHGIDVPALPKVVGAIEQLAADGLGSERAQSGPGMLAPMVRLLLAPVAAVLLRPQYLTKLKLREGAEAGAKDQPSRSDAP